MFELDLSIRPFESRTDESCVSSSHSDISCQTQNGSWVTEETRTQTEEDAMMDSLYDDTSPQRKRRVDGFLDELEDAETKRLRAMVEEAFASSGNEEVPPEPVSSEHCSIEMDAQPPHDGDVKNMWKHAGVLREYGGVKAWMESMKKSAPASGPPLIDL